MTYHKSVLVREVVEYLQPRANGLYIDATFGGGGHTTALLESEPSIKVLGCDWDMQALERNTPAVIERFGDRFSWAWSNFSMLPDVLKTKGWCKVDGILADFGTSQAQIFERPGFSFATDTPLDMRMSPSHSLHTAAQIVNRSTEEELVYIFSTYGEERFSKRIARMIVQERKKHRIQTTGDLVKIILSVVPLRRDTIHPATRVFQALRIVVNQELEHINTFLKHAAQITNPGGRLVCISFHSLEDRLVKTYARDHDALWKAVTKKIVTAADEELAENPSSRSARLRAFERQ